MDNLQEQSNQAPDPEKQQELQDNSSYNRSNFHPEWDALYPEDTESIQEFVDEIQPKKQKDPLVMFEANVPSISLPKRGGVRRKYTEEELYQHQGWRLKFKHDKNGEDRYFVSLCGQDMMFYFSFEEYEKHRLQHQGSYTHHPFKVFDWAIDFYRKRIDKYDHKHTIEELEREFFLFNNPDQANSLSMAW